MKFDGYYMMADALEVPNLKQKSDAAASGWAQRYVLGLRGGGPAQFFSHELGPLFGLYAVASYFYGWLVLYRISTRMFDMLAPYGLDFLSHSYVWLYLFTALALPCYRLMKSTYQNPVTRVAAGRRFAQIGVGLAAPFCPELVHPVAGFGEARGGARTRRGRTRDGAHARISARGLRARRRTRPRRTGPRAAGKP